MYSSIGLASDHAGFELKEKIKIFLETFPVIWKDYGTAGLASVDYPDYGKALGAGLLLKEIDAGIAICGTGIGMAIACNRIAGVRAYTPWDVYSAGMGRTHNDCNMLCLGARTLKDDQAFELIRIWLSTPFEGGRHAVRLKKIENQ
jgi:ribose 5-phosphate isomerase B